MARKRKTIADKLRTAIARAERRGITWYQIAKATGISQSTLYLFMLHEDRQLRLDVAERVAEAAGYRLDLTRRPA